ncbi:unnamed protein product [Boreogadus saida]
MAPETQEDDDEHMVTDNGNENRANRMSLLGLAGEGGRAVAFDPWRRQWFDRHVRSCPEEVDNGTLSRALSKQIRDVDTLEGQGARLEGQGFMDQGMGTRKTIQASCKAFCAPSTSQNDSI